LTIEALRVSKRSSNLGGPFGAVDANGDYRSALIKVGANRKRSENCKPDRSGERFIVVPSGHERFVVGRIKSFTDPHLVDYVVNTLTVGSPSAKVNTTAINQRAGKSRYSLNGYVAGVPNDQSREISSGGVKRRGQFVWVREF
jgi:hypothetical protein